MKYFRSIFIILTPFVYIFAIAQVTGLDKDLVKNILFNPAGTPVYQIGTEKQGFDQFNNDYLTYISLNHHSNEISAAQKSSTNKDNFAQLRMKQDLIIHAALNSDLIHDSTFLYFIRQNLREGIVKGYLYRNIPNVDKIRDAKYSEDTKFLEETYEKNKKQYDDKNISRDEALKALKDVYNKKKAAIIEFLIKKEEDKIIERLREKYTPVINKQAVENLGFSR